ncbi:hypothetical protein [Archangium sp.]|uniref:hypothetical protein n=1 Tax=Archangium sp. TaxID=1872627 RepID=UPI002D3CFFE7|nr:hypothetical protein [Archangium sp.]HYO55711.1 hypothetical protein [Archangium sp.]
MTGRAKMLSVMVLTEDSGAGAYDTVQALVKEMLKLLVRGVQTHRIGFTPLENESARRAMHANLWKSDNPRDERDIRLLIRSIINELLKPNGFVLYHLDADCPWSEQTASEAGHEASANVREFHSRMCPPIEAGLRQELLKRSHDEKEPEKRMKRFRLLVPFYSIEAWLYQNTREARRLCEEGGCGQCPTKLTEWEKDRASLDDVIKPKEALCFQDKYNAHLASSGFPDREVFDADASFTRSVEGLLECDELTGALERTFALPEQPAP